MLKEKNSLFLHIGMQRTGSTFLQREVFPRIDICFGRRLSDVDNFKKCSRVLISNENIWWCDNGSSSFGRRFEKLDVLKKRFPDAKIVFGVRDQKDLLLSWYKKYVIKGGVLSFQDFQRDMVCFSDLDYTGYVERLKQVYGSGNVLVYSFEDLKNSPVGVVEKICGFFGVSCPVFGNVVYNRGYSLWQLKLCRLLNNVWRNKYNPSGFFRRKYNQFFLRRVFQSPCFPVCLMGRKPTVDDLGGILN